MTRRLQDPQPQAETPDRNTVSCVSAIAAAVAFRLQQLSALSRQFPDHRSPPSRKGTPLRPSRHAAASSDSRRSVKENGTSATRARVRSRCVSGGSRRRRSQPRRGSDHSRAMMEGVGGGGGHDNVGHARSLPLLYSPRFEIRDVAARRYLRYKPHREFRCPSGNQHARIERTSGIDSKVLFRATCTPGATKATTLARSRVASAPTAAVPNRGHRRCIEKQCAKLTGLAVREDHLSTVAVETRDGLSCRTKSSFVPIGWTGSVRGIPCVRP